MTRMAAPKGDVKGFFIVRDKDGNPKFSSAKTALVFWDMLTDTDKAYLREKFSITKE